MLKVSKSNLNFSSNKPLHFYQSILAHLLLQLVIPCLLPGCFHDEDRSLVGRALYELRLHKSKFDSPWLLHVPQVEVVNAIRRGGLLGYVSSVRPCRRLVSLHRHFRLWPC